ncbi:hypothetical protein Ccr29_gp148 [Caulobacter phage Ccr29]|uniref:Uncharacterized protein n=3 Tax=Shapirovirus cbk TaxID=1204537 RepID=J3SVT3_9CAUD|nr:hypothetical protein phiCbK_176 [Caulobacter phage phiCbK]ARB14704.1 hypothetical protein Ccr29_gp148 [Caulobacter phage Ccr29]ARB15059.1 hypothetical protein Ccr32_gp141 [Caulobacter phage Ccr32]ARB15393.1 hypothetical protein Ccr34_gp151 [Caulobacter phage Ccr34]
MGHEACRDGGERREPSSLQSRQVSRFMTVLNHDVRRRIPRPGV